jgi:hypothetical protein
MCSAPLDSQSSLWGPQGKSTHNLYMVLWGLGRDPGLVCRLYILLIVLILWGDRTDLHLIHPPPIHSSTHQPHIPPSIHPFITHSSSHIHFRPSTYPPIIHSPIHLFTYQPLIPPSIHLHSSIHPLIVHASIHPSPLSSRVAIPSLPSHDASQCWNSVIT